VDKTYVDSQTPYGRLNPVLGAGGTFELVASRELEPLPTLHSRRRSRAGFSPSARLPVLCAVAVATALVAAAVAQSSTTRRLEVPARSEISRASSPIVDKEVAAGVSAVAPAGYWGGEYRTAAGESVTIYASNIYPVDPLLGQRWADFLGSLVHGPEISTVTVLLATSDEIARVCGSDAVACYSPQGAVLYTPGEDPGSDLSAEAVITHEYGHHVAANRSDAPWSALNYGPKRWASAMQVCARTRSGELFPGAEDARHYAQNPGEGWAETYRVLNERKAGLAEVPWQIVTQALYPTAAALTAAEQDVTTPWRAPTTTTQTGTLSRTKKTRTFTVATPLDGTLKMTLKHSAGMRLSVDVFASSTRAAHVVTTGVVSRTFTACGARSYRFRVTELAGRGSVSLTVAKP
jgi:hypothetical protein